MTIDLSAAKKTRKHWVYPSERVPVEFALGPLTINPDKSGCDLRPSDPRLGPPKASTCGAKSKCG
ncbi:hypothetical protein [Polyangium sp. 6x1]|uniref:hypothetical protein n=1 Tax=Polyangium sp. 6x1 TaxID=3042689 RepID=UPI002482AA2D|nr:hypothetical protein [Polyangium sp. 6x1]MDI1449999.1 hypothetical protein [Polyangium sp. 6x1]